MQKYNGFNVIQVFCNKISQYLMLPNLYNVFCSNFNITNDICPLPVASNLSNCLSGFSFYDTSHITQRDHFHNNFKPHLIRIHWLSPISTTEYTIHLWERVKFITTQRNHQVQNHLNSIAQFISIFQIITISLIFT